MHNHHGQPPIAQLQVHTMAVSCKCISCGFMRYKAQFIKAPCVCHQAPESLTSLDDGLRVLEAWGPKVEEGGVASIAQVLQGICSLRSLSCSVRMYTRPGSLCCISATCTSQPAVWQWHAAGRAMHNRTQATPTHAQSPPHQLGSTSVKLQTRAVSAAHVDALYIHAGGDYSRLSGATACQTGYTQPHVRGSC